MLTCQCSVDVGRRELRSFRFKLVPVDGCIENRKIKRIERRGNGKDKEIIVDEMQQCTRKKTRLRCALSLEWCMSCFESFEGTGRTEDDGRLPMAPCSGCGYQICLKCVRMQHAQRLHVQEKSISCQICVLPHSWLQTKEEF